ncbi:MAG: hypothetical protein ACP5NV_00190 [Candidatus Woesearchaeota archaeon]
MINKTSKIIIYSTIILIILIIFFWPKNAGTEPIRFQALGLENYEAEKCDCIGFSHNYLGSKSGPIVFKCYGVTTSCEKICYKSINKEWEIVSC